MWRENTWNVAILIVCVCWQQRGDKANALAQRAPITKCSAPCALKPITTHKPHSKARLKQTQSNEDDDNDQETKRKTVETPFATSKLIETLEENPDRIIAFIQISMRPAVANNDSR